MLQHGKKQHGKSAKWKQCPIKSATWKKWNTKKVHTEKVNHECNTKRVKKVKHRENMKSERNSETWVECYTEKVQHDESATRRVQHKKVKNGKSAQWKKQHEKVQYEKSAIWGKGIMEKTKNKKRVHQENSATNKNSVT